MSRYFISIYKIIQIDSKVGLTNNDHVPKMNIQINLMKG